jgi:hypothetical protein
LLAYQPLRGVEQELAVARGIGAFGRFDGSG